MSEQLVAEFVSNLFVGSFIAGVVFLPMSIIVSFAGTARVWPIRGYQFAILWICAAVIVACFRTFGTLHF